MIFGQKPTKIAKTQCFLRFLTPGPFRYPGPCDIRDVLLQYCCRLPSVYSHSIADGDEVAQDSYGPVLKKGLRDPGVFKNPPGVFKNPPGAFKNPPGVFKTPPGVLLKDADEPSRNHPSDTEGSKDGNGRKLGGRWLKAIWREFLGATRWPWNWSLGLTFGAN